MQNSFNSGVAARDGMKGRSQIRSLNKFGGVCV